MREHEPYRSSSLPAYLAVGSGYGDGPSVFVSVEKLGNGYQIDLRTNPPRPKPRVVAHAPSPFVGRDPDEIIDQIIDGLGSLVSSIQDKGAGEDWKDGEHRVKVRETFRVMFPSMARQIDDVVSDEPEPVYEEPRHEQLVFESKKSLMEFLEKNL